MVTLGTIVFLVVMALLVGTFVLASGVVDFVVIGYWAKDMAGRNPWGAGGLEWEGDTPSPPSIFRTLPIVRHHDPLWGQRDLHTDDPEVERVAHGMAEAPAHFRAGISSSVLDARPEAIMHLSTPSLWPLLMAGFIALAFVAAIYDVAWVIIPAALAAVAWAIG